MLEISDNLKINLNAVVTINKVKDKWIARLKNGSSVVVTEEIANEIITSTGSSGGGGGASITANIKITSNKDDILGTTEHNKLCILSNTGDLSFKVVDKIEGGSEEISTLNEVLPQGLSSSCCARFNNNIYIFGNYSNTIYKFNCISKITTTLSVTLPQSLGNACCSIYNDNIYIFGGYSSSAVNTIYRFNCSNETITTLSVTLPITIQGLRCSLYNDYIYVFGGYQYNSRDYYYDTIYKFNCFNETITTLSVRLPQKLWNICCSIYNDNIYIFGGSSGSAVNTIYRFNCSSETITTSSVTLPQVLSSACCSTYDDNIYIFGGSSGSAVNTIYNFSISFELIANSVLIYNANSNYSFDLITDQVTIPISKIYIGDSTNTAQLANAYLYDETQSAWINVNTGEVLS